MKNDPIRNIIHSFREDEKKEFQSFIHRQKVKKTRKDLSLFHILNEKSEYKASEIEFKLYEKKSSNAYQSIRKRLMNHLMHFIVVKRMDDDSTAESKVFGFVSIARFLLERGKNKAGWDFLIKAEKMAKLNESYASLGTVFRTQIQYADRDFAPDFDSILIQKVKFQELSQKEERAEIASMEIRLKLKEMRISGSEMNLQDIVYETMKKIRAGRLHDQSP